MFRMGAKTKQSLEQGFGDPYTISIIRNTRNSTGNHLGPRFGFQELYNRAALHCQGKFS